MVSIWFSILAATFSLVAVVLLFIVCGICEWKRERKNKELADYSVKVEPVSSSDNLGYYIIEFPFPQETDRYITEMRRIYQIHTRCKKVGTWFTVLAGTMLAITIITRIFGV